MERKQHSAYMTEVVEEIRTVLGLTYQQLVDVLPDSAYKSVDKK